MRAGLFLACLDKQDFCGLPNAHVQTAPSQINLKMFSDFLGKPGAATDGTDHKVRLQP